MAKVEKVDEGAGKEKMLEKLATAVKYVNSQLYFASNIVQAVFPSPTRSSVCFRAHLV